MMYTEDNESYTFFMPLPNNIRKQIKIAYLFIFTFYMKTIRDIILHDKAILEFAK